jgi:hypothetical protein
MVSRLLLAGACALGIATTSAAPALADLGPATPKKGVQLYVPAAVQVWSPEGLVRTIDCPNRDAHPACDPAGWPDNTDALAAEHGGYRALARNGRWFEMGGNQKTVDAMKRADAAAGRGATTIVGGFDELDAFERLVDLW